MELFVIVHHGGNNIHFKYEEILVVLFILTVHEKFDSILLYVLLGIIIVSYLNF